jgi:hypothetical protein
MWSIAASLMPTEKSFSTRSMFIPSGELLGQFEVESGIIRQPVTYRGPDGKQYVAILAGVGGWPVPLWLPVSMRATSRPQSARQT